MEIGEDFGSLYNFFGMLEVTDTPLAHIFVTMIILLIETMA